MRDFWAKNETENTANFSCAGRGDQVICRASFNERDNWNVLFWNSLECCMKKGLLYLGVVGLLGAQAVVAQERPSNFYIGAGYGAVAVDEQDGFTFSDAKNGIIQLGYKISENFAIEGQYSKSSKDASTELTIDDIDVTEAWWDGIAAMNPGSSLSSIQSVFPYTAVDLRANVDANIETTAIYGVYRSGGDLYFKAKLGYLNEKTTLTGSANALDFHVYISGVAEPDEFTLQQGDDGFEDFTDESTITESESDSGVSAGLGLGYKFTDRFFSELEYTMLSDDLNMYSLSINFAF
jgi:outer membrane immunogenic protein